MLYREAGQFKTSYTADMAVFPIRQDRIAMGLLLLFAFIGIPLLAKFHIWPFGGEYLLRAILLPFLILSLAAVGLNILTGYCGQLSLGSGAFMAIGAYCAYKFATGVEILFLAIPPLPVLPSILLGGLMSALVGVLFGVPSLRIKGLYLAVATLAAQFFFDWVFARVKWFTNYTPSGSVNAPQLDFFGYIVNSPIERYLLCLTFVVVFAMAAEESGARQYRPAMDGDPGHGHRRRIDRHPPALFQADGVRDLLVHHRRGRERCGRSSTSAPGSRWRSRSTARSSFCSW